MNHAEDIALQEKTIVHEILKNGTSLEEFLFFRDSLKRNEDLCEIPLIEKFVLVGGGALPSTAFTLLKLKKVNHLTIVDIDEEALTLAKRLFQSNNIEADFIHSSGSHFDYSQANGIYIANLVQDKAEALKRCELTSQPNTWLTLRCSTQKVLGVDNFSHDQVSKDCWSFKFKGNSSEEFSSCNYHFQKN